MKEGENTINGKDEYKIVREKSSSDTDPRFTLFVDNEKQGENLTWTEIRNRIAEFEGENGV